MSAQQACPAVPEATQTPASNAYAHGRYKEAEEQYAAEVALHPDSQPASIGLIQSLLHEGKASDAAAIAEKLVAASPGSAVALTAQAEVQFHQGQPWSVLDTLARAESADPCYARIHYVRSRVFRLDSKYASERAEVSAARHIDPNDPDIHRAWLNSVQPAGEVSALHESLAATKDIDPVTQQQALKSIHDMMQLLTENNQTCQVTPTLPEKVTIPLAAFYDDSHRVAGYRLEAQFRQSKAHLTIDTAASGLFISRALADLNGFTSSPDSPPGTVHVDRVEIGGLEFKDCIVGVSDAPFSGNAEGFVGTDLFSPWLIDLDQPAGKLSLSELPPQPAFLPGDRPTGSAIPAPLQGFAPVYHRQQFLLVPVALSNKSSHLFAIDTGSRVSTMSSPVAHAVSTTKVNFTNRVQTISGATIEVYRDAFDFQFASLALPHQGHIVAFDPSRIERNTGIEVAGLLGFEMLGSLDIKLDYRDGLVHFESPSAPESGSSHGSHAQTAIAAAEPSCPPDTLASQPLNTTMQAKVVGLIDSAHLKSGSKITLKLARPWSNGTCELGQDSVLYGHAVESRSTKSPDSSEVSLVFDAGECFEKGKVQKHDLSLIVIGLVGPPDQFVGIQSALPSQVAGGGRNIQQAARDIGSGFNEFSINLNPSGPPDTIKHGIVQGMPGVQLQPQGGPGCSAKITGTGRSIHFGEGSQFILTPVAPPAGNP